MLHTSRELLRHSCFCHEFSTVALLHALIAMEIVLRAKISDSGTKPLHALIKQGRESGLLTERQTEFLHEGRKLRNRIAHGQRARSVMPPHWGDAHHVLHLGQRGMGGQVDATGRNGHR
ncbi:DUF4145 domain-containing protein [Streptomyces sp. NPDC002120]|uniref:DUF4145 domain-containing protein n=1 Tax=Streptomyces sp. NPDC002120 TaxID=3364631 RepID=UPI00368DCACB